MFLKEKKTFYLYLTQFVSNKGLKSGKEFMDTLHFLSLIWYDSYQEKWSVILYHSLYSFTHTILKARILTLFYMCYIHLDMVTPMDVTANHGITRVLLIFYSNGRSWGTKETNKNTCKVLIMKKKKSCGQKRGQFLRETCLDIPYRKFKL